MNCPALGIIGGSLDISMRILITGATGFVGGHLAEALFVRGSAELFALCRKNVWPAEWSHLAARIPLHTRDLVEAIDLTSILSEIRPDWIVHLAAYAHVGQSFREADLVWRTNLDGTRRLYDAVAGWGGKPRILFVSSGLVYGDGDKACQEDHPLRPASPYAASKAAADLASYQYTRHPGLDIVRVRPFNHVGPRQSPQYAVARFASQIADIELGRQPPVVETGDLSSRRDLSDVRDVVRAYILLLQKGGRGEAYNVGSGETVSMQEVLNKLIAMAKVRVDVQRRSDQLRPAETAVAWGDVGKLRRETGWKPEYSLNQTLADTLEYWRNQPRANG